MKKRAQAPPSLLTSPAKPLGDHAEAAALLSPSVLAPKIDLATEHREYMEKVAQQVKEQIRLVRESPEKAANPSQAAQPQAATA